MKFLQIEMKIRSGDRKLINFLALLVCLILAFSILAGLSAPAQANRNLSDLMQPFPLHRLNLVNAKTTINLNLIQLKEAILASDHPTLLPLFLIAHSFKNLILNPFLFQVLLMGIIFALSLHISKLQRLEKALNFSERKRSIYIKHNPLAVIEWNTDFEIIEWNLTAELIFGYRQEEVLGKSLIELIFPPHIQAFIQQICNNLTQKKANYTLINQNLTKDNRRITCQWDSMPLLDDNNRVVGFSAFIQDITESQQVKAKIRQLQTHNAETSIQLEQALVQLKQTHSYLIKTEKMSVLGQLIAGVAHEINNPVNFIYGNLTHARGYAKDMLKMLNLYQKYYPDPVAEIQTEIEAIDLEFLLNDLPLLLNSMNGGADRIRKTIHALQNHSYLDHAEAQAIDIHKGIESTLVILHHRLKAKPHYPAIHLIKDYGNLPMVECYPGQLNQVLIDLLINAIDAIEEKDRQRSLEEIRQNPSAIAIQTEMSKATDSASMNCAVIRISDNGLGMSEEIQQKLFSPFFTTKSDRQGLGLAISYKIIVEKHGGKISFCSEIGKGTEFAIQIPVRQTQTLANSLLQEY